MFQKMSLPMWLNPNALWIVPLLVIACYCSLKLSIQKRTAEADELPEMKIAEIYVYPIKSLRAVKLASATATAHGFAHDRSFMLRELTPGSPPAPKNMAVSTHPYMTQFLQELSSSPSSTSTDKTITVTHLACGDVSKQSTISIPLTPSTAPLETLEVNLHGSSTTAYRMPQHYNEWFSTCFGFTVELLYLGPNRRSPRFSEMASSTTATAAYPPPFLPLKLPLLKSLSLKNTSSSSQALSTRTLTFADCAPYLLCTTSSLSCISSRLSPSPSPSSSCPPLDITKFRPNILLAGPQPPFAEDFWAALCISSSQSSDKEIEVALPHNCVRCTSVNLDYDTGRPGKGPHGEVLKKMQGDRRVDKGARWSPVFGRYGFWMGEGGKEKEVGEVVWSVGDKVRVTRVNGERTVWSWPGLG